MAKITPTTDPNAGLDENYCRNPDSSSQIWCYIKIQELGGGESFQRETCAPRTEAYDYCYNKMQIKAHNKYRQDHKSKDQKFKIESAIGAQKYLDGLKTSLAKPPASKKDDRPDGLKECGENIFKKPTADKQVTKDTDVASATWYATGKFYDHEEDKAKASSSAAEKEEVK